MEEGDSYLSDMKPMILYQLRNILDEDDQWKELVAACPHYSLSDFENFQNRRSIQSPAFRLLNEFCREGMTISALVNLMLQRKLERPLMLLCDHEPPEVKVPPPETITLFSDGRSLKIEFQADGFPFPTYEWFRYSSDVCTERWIATNKNNSVLELSPITKSLEGTYFCIFYNENEEGKTFYRRTNDVHVIVVDRNFRSSENNLCIRKQPQSPADKIAVGSSILLEVKAEGNMPLKYEWFRNNESLPDEHSSILHLREIEPENGETSWIFHCRISDNTKSLLSEPVKITLDSVPQIQEAEDKIAIFIGNQNYINRKKLYATITDVQTLTKKFSEMKYKVFEFCNLTYKQMIDVINYVCEEFINEGVYVVFYFAGHGFQFNEQCCMIPVDAPHETCKSTDIVYVQEIIEKIQHKQPKVLVTMFDMCRKYSDELTDLNSNRNVCKDFERRPNTLIVYSTTESLSAYERKKGNGEFVSTLMRFLNKDMSIEEIFSKVKNFFSDRYRNDEKNKNSPQYPWIAGNLLGKAKFIDPFTKTKNPATINREKQFCKLIAPPPKLKCDFGFASVIINYESSPNVFRNIIEANIIVIINKPNPNMIAIAEICSRIDHVETTNEILELCPENSLTKSSIINNNLQHSDLELSLKVIAKFSNGSIHEREKPFVIHFPNLCIVSEVSHNSPSENTESMNSL